MSATGKSPRRPSAAAVSRLLAKAGFSRSQGLGWEGFRAFTSYAQPRSVEVIWNLRSWYSDRQNGRAQKLAQMHDALSEKYDVTRDGDVLYVRRKGGEA